MAYNRKHYDCQGSDDPRQSDEEDVDTIMCRHPTAGPSTIKTGQLAIKLMYKQKLVYTRVDNQTMKIDEGMDNTSIDYHADG